MGDAARDAIKLGGGNAASAQKSMAVEVFLPDSYVKRTIKAGPQSGLTHRKLLPTIKRAKSPGSRFFESSIRLPTPTTRRDKILLDLPSLPSVRGAEERAVSCPPDLSGITGHLNRKMDYVAQQVSHTVKKGDKGASDEGASSGPDAAALLAAAATKKQHNTGDILKEVREIMSTAGQYFEAAPVKKDVHKEHHSNAKGKEKQEDKKKGAPEGFIPKTPKALFEHTMAQIHMYKSNSEKRERLVATVKELVKPPETTLIDKNVKQAWHFSPAEKAARFEDYKTTKMRLMAHAREQQEAYDQELMKLKEEVYKAHAAKAARAERAIQSRFRNAANSKRNNFDQMGAGGSGGRKGRGHVSQHDQGPSAA